MQIVIENSNFAQVGIFQRSIGEFTEQLDLPEDIIYRGEHLHGVVIKALDSEDRCRGLLFGYREKKYSWYNHITAVDADFRKQGIATGLILTFETYCRDHKAQAVRVKSKNCFPHMLRLLIYRSYAIIGLEQDKILFEKKLT
ncbi:MAG: GNAT family N-acetyltransferase [Fibrobacterota bacterium]